MKIQSLDRNKSPLSLSYHGIKHHSSKTGGICSLIFIIVMLVVTFYKLNELLIIKSAKLTSYQITESSQLDLDDADIFICIRDLSDPNNWEKFVGFDEQYEYGINVTIAAVDQRRVQGVSRQLVPCNFSQYSYSSQYFCIPQDMHLQVHGRDDRFRQKRKSNSTQKLQKYLIRIRPCNQTLQTSCKKLSGDLLSNIIFRHSPITHLENTSNIVFQHQTKQLYSHTFLSHQLMYVHNIYFQLLQIITDNSILPTALYDDTEVEQGIYSDDDDNKIQVIEREYLDQDQYAIYIIMRGASTTRYLRSYAKVDFVLAEILGLMGTISFFVFAMYQGYNQWKFQRELAIAQEREEGINKNLEKPNLIVYYKQKITNFCKRSTNRPITQSQSKTQQQNAHKLDIYYLTKRIQMLQSLMAQNKICKNCNHTLNYNQQYQHQQKQRERSKRSRQNIDQNVRQRQRQRQRYIREPLLTSPSNSYN